MAQLVLLTHCYPQSPGEEFVEPELEILARQFERVYLVPLLAVGGAMRPVPDNVSVVPLAPAVRGRLGRAATAPLLALDSQARAWWRAESAEAMRVAGRRGLIRLSLSMHGAARIRGFLGRRFPNRRGVVFYSYWLGLGATALAMWKEEAPDVVAVARAHGADVYWERSSPPYIPAQATVVAGLDRVFTVSQHGCDYLRDRGILGNVSVSRLGVEVGGRLASPSVDGTFRIVSCSSVVTVKRLPLLVEALRQCRQPIEWTHLGGGPGLPTLQAAAETLPPSVRTRFTGALAHEDVLSHYRANPVDLFVNVSESEGLPVSIAEAMSHGIPVLATAAGGTPELVDAESGWILPVDVPAAELTKALDALATASSPERSSKGVSAAQRVARIHDARSNYSAFAAELQKLVVNDG